MADDMYKEEWFDVDNEKRKTLLDKTSFALSLTEDGKLPVVFDAADFTRAGKDVFCCISMTTNEAGMKWVQRELKPFGFRIHPMRFKTDTTPMHIDATFVLLRPFLAMRNPYRPPYEGYEDIFI
jgi:glycine amidinotransferase